MSFGTWIAIYIPLFVLFFVLIPQQNLMHAQAYKMIVKRRRSRMLDHKLIKKYIGRECKITTGSYGTTTSGKVLDVKENWIEIETRKGIELMNAEFVQNIKVKN